MASRVSFGLLLICVSTEGHNNTIITCPRGSYKSGSSCALCPKGTFGVTGGLTSPLCSGLCPAGRYRDKFGGVTPDDCELCPVGRFGATAGLISSACSGKCVSGYYSRTPGITSNAACIKCPPQYLGWQCANDHGYADWTIIPKGKLDGSDSVDM